MGISTKQLHDERTVLKKTFDELQGKLQMIEKETTAYRNNLNAVGGAIQQIDKLISLDKNFGNGEGAKQTSLDISEKEQPELLNEEDK